MRIAVVVLGDLGRSPRTLYHALALGDEVGEVDLVGHCETPLDPRYTAHARIRIHTLASQEHLPRAGFVWRGIRRVTSQALVLLRVLLTRVPRPDVIVVQNPPALPTLAVALLAARLRSARLVIDWHNLAYSMLALRLGDAHVLVRLARWYEGAIGRRADAHLCVSAAMARELSVRWGVPNAVVLRDRPEARFVPTSPTGKSALLARLDEERRLPRPPRDFALIVSPTSWTADEDTDLLLEAAARFDRATAGAAERLPDLLIVVTGRGPARNEWARRAAALSLRRVHLRTLWLDDADYAPFVGAADLGLSLHRSSSKLDLPMKIADLLGAGVPVCALDYGPCLAEVLRHGENGLVFSSAEELAAQWRTLFDVDSAAGSLLARLRHNVALGTTERWRDAWRTTARPLFAASGR
jgi:beta-1,4-mannosyltransferase